MVAIDTLQFKFSVLEQEPEAITEGPDDGVYVYGLWMEGARFDREQRLMQPSRHGEMYTVSRPRDAD
jgi:dynein heavy chain